MTNNPDTRNSLHLHRTIDVRQEARAALLAYAYLRGRPYHQVERPNSTTPDWTNVKRIAKKFGGEPFVASNIDDWAIQPEKAAIAA